MASVLYSQHPRSSDLWLASFRLSRGQLINEKATGGGKKVIIRHSSPGLELILPQEQKNATVTTNGVLEQMKCCDGDGVRREVIFNAN